jgi:hypothetical protein
LERIIANNITNLLANKALGLELFTVLCSFFGRRAVDPKGDVQWHTSEGTATLCLSHLSLALSTLSSLSLSLALFSLFRTLSCVLPFPPPCPEHIPIHSFIASLRSSSLSSPSPLIVTSAVSVSPPSSHAHTPTTT